MLDFLLILIMTIATLTLALLLAGPPGGGEPALTSIQQARTLVEAGRLSEAGTVLQNAISQHPDHADLRVELARLQLRQNNFVAASISLEEALDRSADPRVVLPMLGQAYLVLKQPARARSALEKAVRHDPSDLGSQYNLGRLLRVEGEAQAAIPVLEKALSLNPQGRMLHRIQVNLGALYLDVHRYSPALALYEDLSRQDPEEAEWRYNLAVAHGRLGEPRAALERTREAIRLEPEMARAHLLAGTQLRTLGKLEEALRAALRASELDPTAAQALALAASLELDLGRHEQALGRARRLVEIDPTHSSGHYLLGQALLASGDQDGAEAEFATHRRLAAERRSFHHTAASMGDE